VHKTVCESICDAIQPIIDERLEDCSALVLVASPPASDFNCSVHGWFDYTVTPAVCDLGIYIDCGLTMLAHVAKIVSSCFKVLQRIRSIRRSVTKPVIQSLVVYIGFTRLDYGSATLAALPNVLLDRLQSALHAAARLIYSARGNTCPRPPLVTSSRENSVPSGSARLSLPAIRVLLFMILY